MKKYLILFLFMLVTLLGSANSNLTQTIRGIVIDAVTEYPLPGATIIVLNTEPVLGAVTGDKGNFKIENVPVGRQSIEIRYVGYKPYYANNLLITSGKETVLEVRLEESPLELEEVVVKASQDKQNAQNEMAMVSARTFSIEETERFAGTLGDPAKLVANYAGVMTQNDSRNDIIIRGNSPIGVQWRMEGVEIPNPNHFAAQGTTGGPVSMVNNNLLTNSDFLTGAFPAEFGNATAGAFDLNLRSGNNQQYEFLGQIGFNGFEIGAEGPVWTANDGINPSFVINYRYSTYGVMNRLGYDAGTGTALPEYQDLTFLIDIPGSKLGHFKVFGLYGKSFISFGRDTAGAEENSYMTRDIANDYECGVMVGGLTHTYFFNEKSRIKSTVSYQTSSTNMILDSVIVNGTEFKPIMRSDEVEKKLSFTTQYKQKISAKDNFSIGIIVDHFEVYYMDSLWDSDSNRFYTLSDIDGGLNLLRGYAQWQHKFNEKLMVYGGLHAQYFELNDEFVLEPRLSIKWEFAPKQSLTAGYGKHSQLQPKMVYFVQEYNGLTGEYERTNEDLKFTKSDHYVLGYNYAFNNQFRFKMETYYQHLYDVPVKENFPEFSMLNAGGDFGIPVVDSLVNKGTGYNYGIELTAEKFLEKGYYFLFTASLFNSKYEGYDGVERNTAFNGNYVFNLLAGYEYKFNEKTMLTFDLKTVWAGGRRYIDYDREASIAEGVTVYDYSNVYESRYNDYFRTDLRIGYKKNLTKITYEFGLDLQNLTNYKSVFYQMYDVANDEVYTVYQQSFMPNFLFRIQF